MEHVWGLFPSHFECWQGDPVLVALHTLSDGLIALSYFAIPAALFYLARRYRIKRLSSVFVIYGLFIAGCGATHVFDVVTVWRGGYWLFLADGVVRALTGVVSVAAAVVTVRCAKDAIVGFTRLTVLERRMGERLRDLKTEERFHTEPDREWARTLEELKHTVGKIVAYAPPEAGERVDA